VVAEDVERLPRFEREAKVLASLSHQNIATVVNNLAILDARTGDAGAAAEGSGRCRVLLLISSL